MQMDASAANLLDFAAHFISIIALMIKSKGKNGIATKRRNAMH